jgi:hypothetical protein
MSWTVIVNQIAATLLHYYLQLTEGGSLHSELRTNTPGEFSNVNGVTLVIA